VFAIDHQRRLILRGDHAYDPATRQWQSAVAGTQAESMTATDAMRWLQAESGHPLRAPVGVIGPNEATPEQQAAARQVGSLLGRMRLTLLCGGRQGVMEAACRGAAEAGGLTIGLLPHADPDLANPFVTVPIASGIGEARNAIIAQAGACLVAVGDSHGTLSEVALGLRLAKAVFGLAGAAQVQGVVQLGDPADLAEPLVLHLLRAPT
jgi:uncharacterized protein (TIGR00725 family)